MLVYHNHLSKDLHEPLESEKKKEKKAKKISCSFQALKAVISGMLNT